MSSHTQNNITAVLVHAAWADGSSWNKVTSGLLRRGFKVVAAQIPLTSLTDDVTALRRLLRSQDAPVVLVGHSYGGAVITAAAAGDPKTQSVWKEKPSWFLIAENDRMVAPETQRYTARRMKSRVVSLPIDHSPLASRPRRGH